jgi:hypothetical protein
MLTFAICMLTDAGVDAAALNLIKFVGETAAQRCGWGGGEGGGGGGKVYVCKRVVADATNRVCRVLEGLAALFAQVPPPLFPFFFFRKR